MSNKPVTENLKVVLADSYAIYLKTQNYHWNVVGPLFKSLHELFEEHYTELAEAIDTIAERIRALDEKAPGSFSAFSELTTIEEGDENAEAMAMVKDLVKSHETLVENLKKTIEAAENANDDASADLAIERIQVHQEAAWMLKSIAA